MVTFQRLASARALAAWVAADGADIEGEELVLDENLAAETLVRSGRDVDIDDEAARYGGDGRVAVDTYMSRFRRGSGWGGPEE